MEDKPKKIKRIKPYTHNWEKLADELARGYCPTIVPCKHCGHPTIHGYCCGFCGSNQPT